MAKKETDKEITENLEKILLNKPNEYMQRTVVEASKNNDVQFLFRVDRLLLKKIKRKALEEETSVKQLLVNAIKDHILK